MFTLVGLRTKPSLFRSFPPGNSPKCLQPDFHTIHRSYCRCQCPVYVSSTLCMEPYKGASQLIHPLCQYKSLLQAFAKLMHRGALQPGVKDPSESSTYPYRQRWALRAISGFDRFHVIQERYCSHVVRIVVHCILVALRGRQVKRPYSPSRSERPTRLSLRLHYT